VEEVQSSQSAMRLPIISTKSTTSAFPIQKYLIRSVIPEVQSSGKPLSHSHSIGVKNLFRPSISTICELRFTEPSLVNIVRPGRFNKSVGDIPPSENTYLWPVADVRSIFFGPLK